MRADTKVTARCARTRNTFKTRIDKTVQTTKYTNDTNTKSVTAFVCFVYFVVKNSPLSGFELRLSLRQNRVMVDVLYILTLVEHVDEFLKHRHVFLGQVSVGLW